MFGAKSPELQNSVKIGLLDFEFPLVLDPSVSPSFSFD
jgi:hypothetical protein